LSLYLAFLIDLAPFVLCGSSRVSCAFCSRSVPFFQSVPRSRASTRRPQTIKPRAFPLSGRGTSLSFLAATHFRPSDCFVRGAFVRVRRLTPWVCRPVRPLWRRRGGGTADLECDVYVGLLLRRDAFVRGPCLSCRLGRGDPNSQRQPGVSPRWYPGTTLRLPRRVLFGR